VTREAIASTVLTLARNLLTGLVREQVGALNHGEFIKFMHKETGVVFWLP
jgi:hypothetical protein